jgi:N-acetyl-gamma-glutamyl-phosphate reductase
MIHAGIVGASGYGGAETLRLLLRRRDVCVEAVTASTSAGKRVDALLPSLAGRTDLVLEEFDPGRLAGLDVVFVSLPSGEGMKAVPRIHGRVGKVIDLGGDFRLKSVPLYERYYRHTHVAAELLREAVYGLPELERERIAEARLVANPGCYPTSAILALLPALKSGLVEGEGIAICSLSGTSGAGRSSSPDMSFTEVNESVRAYKVGTHQHVPEIESVLSGAALTGVTVSFVPHLLPISRGIYTTIHARLTGPLRAEQAWQIYSDYYRAAPFVRATGQIPSIAAVTRTNYCDIGLSVDERTGHLIVISTIDNLIKGAAGQAVQNMNIMFGLPEELGLEN